MHRVTPEVNPYGEEGKRAPVALGGVAQAGGDARAWADPRGVRFPWILGLFCCSPRSSAGAPGPVAGWDLNAGAWFSYRAPLGAQEQVCHDLQNLKMLPVEARRPLLAIKVGAGINSSVLRAHGSTTLCSNR